LDFFAEVEEVEKFATADRYTFNWITSAWPVIRQEFAGL